MTAGEFKKVLNQWPDDTEVFVNLANAINDPAGEYEWHDFTMFEPSVDEIRHFIIDDESTHVCIEVLPDIIGC